MSTPSVAAADPGADAVPRTAWLALFVTTLVFFLVVIDISAVNVAFPSIAADFGVSTAELSWIISGYNITVGALLLVAGRLADSLGRKRLFIPAVAVFLVGSVLCGLAPSRELLIAARVIQAVGGAVLFPTALAVVLPDFPPSKRSTAIGILGATGGLGAVFGPALGSIAIDVWSWRGVFLINVPVCLLVLAVSPRLLRESKNPAASGRIDLAGVVIGTTAIALIMFGIVESEQWGLADVRVIGLVVAGLALIPVLLRRSARHPEPLLELSLFRYRSFAASNLAVALYSLGFTSGYLANSLLLQDVWDLSITETGRALLLSPLLSAVIAPVSGRLADRVGHRWILTAGCLASGLGYLLYLLLLDERPQVWTLYVPVSALLGLGTGSTIATWSSAGMSDIAPAQFGTANATIRTAQQVFYAFGVSVVVILLASGDGSGGMQGYRWAWGFVAATYVAAALAVAVLFPSGSSRDRSGAAV
jgi:EmrB/QacA subfamily drug resistance transporter